MLQTSQLFWRLIKDELDDGFGFVPFIGSGLSAGSGIPTGREILDYLAFCIDDALKNGWNPRRQRWKELTNAKTREERTRWMKETIDSIQGSSGANAGVGDAGESAVRMEAIGAMSNWRAALHFLSRLDIQDGHPVLGAPDTRVTDSFFINLTRDRRPNAGHVMLADLATVMRIRTVLTTNFDTLIEDAFAQAQIPLVPFDVPLGIGLPDPNIVLAQRSIIKLHGGRYGLRADFSLDALPSENDMIAFHGYLSVGSGEHPGIKVIQNHLLVLGSSGDDKRTLKLMEYSLKNDAALKVFWVCHNATIESRVRTYFSQGERDWYGRRVYTLTEPETELFLFELYQHLTLSLPPGSGVYPAFWTIPPSPCAVHNKEKKENYDEYKKDLASKLKQMTSLNERRVLVVHGKEGVSSVVSDVFRELSSKHICIWLDLARLYGEDHLFAIMTSAIADRLGVSLGVPITLCSPHQHRKKELDYYVTKTRKPIILFLNGRDGPDFLRGSAGTKTVPDDWESSAWYPHLGNHLADKAGQFWEFVESLRPSNVILVVLLRETRALPESMTSHLELLCMPTSCVDFDTKHVIGNVMSWLSRSDGAERERQERFVYALSLFRYAVHPAALCSWALIKAPIQCRFDNEDNDYARVELGQEWLSELRKRGAIRGNPSGFVWMHEELRAELQERLAEIFELRKDQNKTRGDLKAECHEGIADWYAKLFRSSSDPCAALESLRHRMYCVTSGGTDNVRHRAAFIEAITTLRLARSRILSCGYSRPFAAIVGRIYETRESHNHMTLGLSVELREACLEIQRDLFRELADFPEELKVIEKQKHIHQNADSRPPADTTALLAKEPGEEHTSRTAPASSERGTKKNPLFDLELKYKDAVAHSGLRLYDHSERSFLDLLAELYELSGKPASDLAELLKEDVKPTVDTVRGLGRQWVDANPDDETKKLMVRTIRRYMFLLMLKAQLVALCDCPTEEGILSFAQRPGIDEYQVLLKRAETFYCLATELMRHIQDYAFLQKENAIIRTNYGVLLANMQRFHEAHRRLNEASAYLKQSSESPDSISWAILDIRRAEVQLTEACDLAAAWVKGRQQDLAANTWRRYVATVNDAQMHLERARRRMEGHRKSVWWWTWSYQLQISICAVLSRLKGGIYAGAPNVQCWNNQQIENLGLVCRSCNGRWKVCHDLFAESMRLTLLDPLRQMRLVELFLFLLTDKQTSPGTTHVDNDYDMLDKLWNHLTAILAHREEKRYTLDERLKRYQKKLIEYANEKGFWHAPPSSIDSNQAGRLPRKGFGGATLDT